MITQSVLVAWKFWSFFTVLRTAFFLTALLTLCTPTTIKPLCILGCTLGTTSPEQFILFLFGFSKKADTIFAQSLHSDKQFSIKCFKQGCETSSFS